MRTVFHLAAALSAVISLAAPTPSFQVQVTGRGPAMILIPGLSSSGDTWTSTVEHYRGRYTCHVVTLAGFAGVPPIVEPLLASARRDLAEYIRQERLDHPTIVGHSLGGTLALGLAAEHPDLVGPLVIVDTLPFLAGAQMQAKNLEDARASIAAMHAYMSNMTRQQYDDSVKAGAATSAMVTSPRDLETLKGWGLVSDPRTVAEAMRDLMSLDLRDDVARIQSPALVLGTWVGWSEQAAKYKIDVPRAPEWFFQQLDTFLADPAKAVRARGVI
jgi:pimeloyl-ACP methyl ester carboxylesterase